MSTDPIPPFTWREREEIQLERHNGIDPKRLLSLGWLGLGNAPDNEPVLILVEPTATFRQIMIATNNPETLYWVTDAGHVIHAPVIAWRPLPSVRLERL